MDPSILLQLQNTLNVLCQQIQTISCTTPGYRNLRPTAQGTNQDLATQHTLGSRSHCVFNGQQRGPEETTSSSAATNINFHGHNSEQSHVNVHNVNDFPPLPHPPQYKTLPQATHRQTTLHRTPLLPTHTQTDGRMTDHTRPFLRHNDGPGILPTPMPTDGRMTRNAHSDPRFYQQVQLSGHTEGWTPGREKNSSPHRSNTVQSWGHTTNPQGTTRAPGQGQRTQGPPPRSTYPQFPQLVKTLNQGARLLHSNINWQNIPVSIDRDLTRISDSLAPPLATPEFRHKIDNLFSELKRAIQEEIRHSNDTNLTQLSNNLSTLSTEHVSDARRVAIIQLTRGNSRISHNMAATYINSFIRTTNTSSSLASCSRTLPATVIPTQNRFTPLTNMDTDIEPDTHTAPEPQQTNFTVPTSPRPRSRQATPPLPPRTSTATTDSTASTTQTSKKRPAPSPASPADQRKRTLLPSVSLEDIAIVNRSLADDRNSSLLPTVSLDDIAAVDRSIASMTSTPAPCSPPANKPHLSDYESWNRDQWQLPEIHPNCSTVLMTASNGIKFAPHTPSDWHTVAYRGARLMNLAKILSNCSFPDHVDTVIISCGLNDRTASSDTQFRNALILLNSTFAKHSSITFRICHLPKFHLAPSDYTYATDRLNTLMDEILKESKRVIPLPKSFLAYTRSHEDWSHLNPASCFEFITLILDHLHSLN